MDETRPVFFIANVSVAFGHRLAMAPRAHRPAMVNDHSQREQQSRRDAQEMNRCSWLAVGKVER
jgi:hypothetical protein